MTRRAKELENTVGIECKVRVVRRARSWMVDHGINDSFPSSACLGLEKPNFVSAIRGLAFVHIENIGGDVRAPF